MEYIYSAMLLHSAGKEVSESAVQKVLASTGAPVDEARVKALVTALKDINIDEAIEKAATVAVAAPAAAAAHPASGGKAEAKKDEEAGKKTEEEAASGLGALFG